MAVSSLPWISTVTFSPGSAQPQTGSGLFCCNTMWLPNTLGSRTSDTAGCEAKRTSASAVAIPHKSPPEYRLFMSLTLLF